MTDAPLTTAQVDARLCQIFQIEDDLKFKAGLCELFIALCEKYDIGKYDGNEKDKWEHLIKFVKSTVESDEFKSMSSLIKTYINIGQLDFAAFLKLFQHPCYHAQLVFIKHLIRASTDAYRTLHADKYFKRVLDLQERVVTRELNTQIIFDHHEYEKEEQRRRLSKIQKYYANDPVKKAFDDILVSIKQDNQLAYPSIIICSPTGSGKTTFALHYCCQQSPAIYSLAHLKMKDMVSTKQSDKDPFHDLSFHLNAAARRDAKKLYRRHEDEDYTFSLSCHSLNWDKDDKKHKYEFVGLIVAIYEELVELRRVDPTAPWTLLQCSIGRLLYKPLTISEGLARLESVKATFPETPLLLFMDNCCSDASLFEEGSKETEREVRLHERVILAHNLARCLQIVVVLLGKDANMLHSICKHYGDSPKATRGFDSKSNGKVSSYLFSDLPAFDHTIIEHQNRIFNNWFDMHPRLMLIADFVLKSATRDNPFLANAWLDGFWHMTKRSQDEDYRMETMDEKLDRYEADPLLFLNMIVMYSQEMVLDRFKSTRGLKDNDYQKFIFGQICYLCMNSTNDLPAGQISNHFGQLFITPDTSDGPFCSLKYNFSKIELMFSKGSEKCLTVNSEFAPFDRSILTVLTLFGISSEHNVFCDEKGEKITAFDALASKNKTYSLYTLLKCAIYIASRANGPAGCSVFEFLARFIQEINETEKVRSEYKPKPKRVVIVDCALGFPCKIKIPMFAPLKYNAWPEELVHFFSQLLLPEGKKPCLGVFQKGSAYLSPDITGTEESANQSKIFVFERFDKSDRVGSDEVLEKIKKLTSEEKNKDCKLFLLIAQKYGDIAKAKKEMMPELDKLECSLWFLEPRNRTRFTVTPYDMSEVRAGKVYQKTVILLSLEACWAAHYMPFMLSQFSA